MSSTAQPTADTTPDVPGTDITVPASDLSAAPAIDRIDPRRLDLIKRTVAKGASNADVGMFLELAAHYDLDPFAKEVWCAKGNGDQLLIMVGRDGLRKIAHRRGLRLDGDVVRAKDTFTITRAANRGRAVEHSYSGSAETRGPIVGAWAEVFDPKTGEALGYFFAHLSEYRPKSEAKLKYSPWGSQESVMILAAAERQALRQATPLSGLLAEGEGEINDERAERHPDTDVPEATAELFEAIGDDAAIALLAAADRLDVTREMLRRAVAAYTGDDPGDLADDTAAHAAIAQMDESTAGELGAWLDARHADNDGDGEARS